MTISVTNLFKAPVAYLNQPIVKERVKEVIGITTFVFGTLTLATELVAVSSPEETPDKMNIVCAKTSLILSAAVSRLGVSILSSLIGVLFSKKQLEDIFGPNTTFADNPSHPRHVVSIIAVMLAIPSVVQSTFYSMRLIPHVRPTETKIHLMTLFTTVTSRPVLHIGNWVCRIFLPQRVPSKA